uniref:SET domain-containing protein n=1 Tax=Chromera velia CCMP2878 TaxID=1169474 RepID=A0A0G4FPC1_9ALVE|eukprot:Cvel_18069.t1-p1 / transcript=Cvel_18069.t1 / gene=Cvel_18069 / organism=Chromera_velia_CCMP2878 / gene_product=hypothetical protein / transcript_product=hypothetical protein / location=Cvel_scaffold1477:30721-32289(+) / protein_length=374 / sequence_SO=supercontig / SO=protein_coding / is_pseudo=false
MYLRAHLSLQRMVKGGLRGKSSGTTARVATIGDGVEVKESKIKGAGLGLFATRDFEDQERITEYEGWEHDKEDVDRNQIPSTFARSLRGSNRVVVVPCTADGCADLEGLRGGAGVINDPTLVMRRDGRFDRDHSKDDQINCEFEEKEYNQGLKARVFAKAIKPIKAGEEILISYGVGWHLSFNQHKNELQKDRDRRAALDPAPSPLTGLNSQEKITSSAHRHSQAPPAPPAGSHPQRTSPRLAAPQSPDVALHPHAFSAAAGPGQSPPAPLSPSTKKPKHEQPECWKEPELKLEEGLNISELSEEQTARFFGGSRSSCSSSSQTGHSSCSHLSRLPSSAPPTSAGPFSSSAVIGGTGKGKRGNQAVLKLSKRKR